MRIRVSQYRLCVFFALFNLISLPVQVILSLPRFYLASSPSLNVLDSPLSLSLSRTRPFLFTRRFTEVVPRVHDRDYGGTLSLSFSLLFLLRLALFFNLYVPLLFFCLHASPLVLPTLVLSRVLASLSFQLLSIFRMTHYRDSKTRAGRIVLVLGKCCAQMRRANESERYGNGEEREKGKRKTAGRGNEPREFFLLGQATGAYNMHPAVLQGRVTLALYSRRKSDTREIARANREVKI